MRTNLWVILIFGLFSIKGWAPPPGKGGAPVGPDASISNCELNPSKQTKVKVKGRDGKEHFICTGQANCGSSTVPVSCKVSEKEPCPVAKKCIQFEDDRLYSKDVKLFTDTIKNSTNLDEKTKKEILSIIASKGLGPVNFALTYPPLDRLACVGGVNQNSTCIYVGVQGIQQYVELRGCALGCAGITVAYFCKDAVPCG